jgi:hypothetical protein
MFGNKVRTSRQIIEGSINITAKFSNDCAYVIRQQWDRVRFTSKPYDYLS